MLEGGEGVFEVTSTNPEALVVLGSVMFLVFCSRWLPIHLEVNLNSGLSLFLQVCTLTLRRKVARGKHANIVVAKSDVTPKENSGAEREQFPSEEQSMYLPMLRLISPFCTS